MIVAKSLTKYNGLKPAIEDVSFEIKRGEIVRLLEKAKPLAVGLLCLRERCAMRKAEDF